MVVICCDASSGRSSGPRVSSSDDSAPSGVENVSSVGVKPAARSVASRVSVGGGGVGGG